MEELCEHFQQESDASPKTKRYKECEKEHLPWVAIRMCLTCGQLAAVILQQADRHATKHFEETGHPVMQAVPDKIWKWCYIHKEYY